MNGDKRDLLRAIELTYIQNIPDGQTDLGHILEKSCNGCCYYRCQIIDFDNLEDKEEYFSLYNKDCIKDRHIVASKDENGTLYKTVCFNGKVETGPINLTHGYEFIPNYKPIDFFGFINDIQDNFNDTQESKIIEMKMPQGTVDGKPFYSYIYYMIKGPIVKYSKVEK